MKLVCGEARVKAGRPMRKLPRHAGEGAGDSDCAGGNGGVEND